MSPTTIPKPIVATAPVMQPIVYGPQPVPVSRPSTLPAVSSGPSLISLSSLSPRPAPAPALPAIPQPAIILDGEEEEVVDEGFILVTTPNGTVKQKTKRKMVRPSPYKNLDGDQQRAKRFQIQQESERLDRLHRVISVAGISGVLMSQ